MTDNRTGETSQMPVWHFGGPDKAQSARLDKLFKRAVALALENFEVFYLRATKEKEPDLLLVKSWTGGGSEVFGPNVLKSLADQAAKSGRQEEAKRWSDKLTAKLNEQRFALSTKLFLKLHPEHRR